MLKYLKSLIFRTQPQIDLSRYFRDSLPSSSGQPVNKTTIFGLPPAYKGISLISNSVANCQKHVFEVQADGGRRKCIEHPAYKLINQQSNPILTSWCFFRQLVTNSIINGNSYAFIDRNALYEPQGLYLLDSSTTAPTIVNGLGMMPEIYYTTTIEGKTINLPSADVIHIKNIGNDTGLVGLSIVDCLKEALGLGLATIKYGSVYFKNGGGTGATVVEYPNTFKTQEQKNEFRQSFEGLHNGLENSSRVVILEAGAKLNKNTIPNDSAQFLESRAFSSVDVANILGLPAHKLNSQVNSSYGSIGAENLAVLSDCYEGWLQNIESELESKLLTEKEKATNSYYIEFDRSKLLAIEKQVDDANSIALYKAGLMSFEEYRMSKNLSTTKFEPPAQPAGSNFGQGSLQNKENNGIN